MKNIVVFLVLAFWGLNTGFAQIEKSLENFDKVKVSDKIELKLIKADENKAIISGENAEEVKLIVKNNRLNIRMETTKFLQGEDIVVQLFYQNIDELVATGGALVSAQETLRQNQFKITANKGAEVELDLEVERIEIKTNSGGEISLTGEAEVQEVIANSGGFYDGENLKTRHTKVTVNAGGKADINAAKTVDAKTRAGGEIHIWGNAEVKEKKIAGGKVKLHR